MAMTPNIPLASWSPDADPTAPGVVTSITNVVPTQRGFTSDRSGVALSGSALSGKCYGARWISKADGTQLVAMATAGDLWCWNGTTLVDRGNLGTFTTYPTTGVRFEQFGEYTLAISRDNPLQATADLANTSFSSVSGAPAAYTMCVASNFVMVANTYDLPSANSYRYFDAWWCSALGDHTDWTPDLATQCDRGRLRQTPGQILRLVAYGPDVIAFKARSMIRGRYVNRPADGIIWEWSVISNEVGIVGPEAIVQVGGLLYFMSADGPYVFNGAGLQRINSFPRAWWIRAIPDVTVYPNLHALTQAVYDPARRVIRWHFTRSASEGDELSAAWMGGCLTYHIETDRWGYSSHPCEWALNVPSGSVYLPEAGNTAYPAVAAVGPYPGTYAAAYVSASSHAICTYTGDAPDARIETGDIGDDDDYLVGTRARMRFLREPQSCVAFHLYRANLGDALTQGESVSRADGKFDFSHSARWHRLRFHLTGDWEAAGMRVQASPAGKR